MTENASTLARGRSEPVGLRLRAPLGAVLVGLLGLVALAALVLATRHGAPPALDRAAHDWSMGHRPSGLVAAARAVTATGTGVFPYAAAVIAGLIAGRDPRRRLEYAAGALAFLLLAQGVRYGLMELIARPRPPLGDWATHASGFAFPSGHATTSALMAGLLLTAIGFRTRGGTGPCALRTAVAALVICWAVAVGLSRILLGVHWATDVLAGWLFAAIWVGLGTTLIRKALPLPQ
ncbi:phosphatase PAP2 family protein [Streptomyces sp. NBC_01618]|uniref:phosphatase PAP2 family protein n=1 Tax=Streptomyces sp. NBC_01618 TaxID=2975900 RepID=UPI00386CEFB7|nr:phosphatase PAP2 family protein [Streptomyces sp. NBC_01618]